MMNYGKQKKIEKVLQDLDRNHNHSIWKEIYLRNKNQSDNALVYRGNFITYKEMFDRIDEYCAALKALGYGKGDEIPVCMSMVPEFIYLFLATSKIGAVINSVGHWFNQGYLIDILLHSRSENIFLTDDCYEELKPVLSTSGIKTVFLFSLKDSLPNGCDLYQEIDDRFKCFDNRIHIFRQCNEERILTKEDFINLGVYYRKSFGNQQQFKQSLETKVSLDDDFTVTYTSGTTNPSCPKAILHSVRSYMTLGRFKDADVSGMGQMRNMTVLAHFPTYVHAGLTTSIIDSLFESCTIAVEPIYDKDFFIHALLINRPNFVCAGTGFWCRLGKLLAYNERYKDISLPFLYIATVTGEGLSPGEEKFLNKVSKDHRFGTEKFPFSLVPVTFSIGGGTSESSGVLVTLFKQYQELRPYYLLRGKSIGLKPLGCCEVRVLRENGSGCDVDEVGSIVLAGPCTMRGYIYDTEYTSQMSITDVDGKVWLKMGAYGSLDKNGYLKIHGRLSDFVLLDSGDRFPLFRIEEAITQNRDSVLSCTVIKVDITAKSHIVVHVEPQPLTRILKEVFMSQVAMAVRAVLPKELENTLFLRYHDNVEGFPVAPSGKRDIAALISEGIENAEKYRDILKEDC